jgi:radical SAM superfamily enzyme YgiQ (UPF0313 family)
VVFGGIHATLYPDEARHLGGAHAVVTGDGEQAWPAALRDCAAGAPRRQYDGGRIKGDTFLPGRWELLPAGRYMWPGSHSCSCRRSAQDCTRAQPDAGSHPVEPWTLTTSSAYTSTLRSKTSTHVLSMG